MIMTRRTLALSVGLCLMLAAGCACVAADFSADLYMGQKSLTKMGKLYSHGNMMRIETKMGKASRIAILCLDKKMIWALDPASKTFTQISVPKGQSIDPRSDAMLAANATKKSLGNEKVGGYACQKTKYVSKRSPKGSAIRWYSKKLGYPVKVQVNMPNGQTSTQELRNIKVGKQPMLLFEIPKGYKKTQVPKGPTPGKKQGGPKRGAPKK